MKDECICCLSLVVLSKKYVGQFSGTDIKSHLESSAKIVTLLSFQCKFTYLRTKVLAGSILCCYL